MRQDYGVVTPARTREEILNGLIKRRCTLGNIWKVHWFQKPVASLKCAEMNSLSSSLWMTSETKIAMLDRTLGNGPNFLRMECDFSKLPKVQMLTEAY